MSKKKHSVLGMAALAAAGAGAAVLANKSREEKQIIEAHVDPNYRNTERGKNEKNSKGIYYTNGNYEAFARPEKPEGVDDKHAYLVGSGLASLAAACFLVRDAQMPGDHIHILEAMDIAGGACDGIFDPMRGYVMRGGREMENHFECLWDLFHSIPSLEKPGASVLDEYYWLNKHDPNYSLCRATVNQGKDAHTDVGNIRNDLVIQCGNSCRFPVGLFNIGAELLGMTKGRILTGDIFPQIPYAAVANFCIAHRSVILISVDRSLCAAAVCYEYQIVFG